MKKNEKRNEYEKREREAWTDTNKGERMIEKKRERSGKR